MKKSTIKSVVLIVFLTFISCTNLPSVTLPSVQEKNNNIILVGTTGDYSPFTIYDSITNQFKGKDIELITKFGQASGKKISFVKTTWKDISKDLLNNKFDIAIGGISVNNKRNKTFIFSTPLLFDRKVALFKKKDSIKFLNFSNIDNSKIKIVENKGGTNEEFAAKNIHYATLILVSKNEETLKMILENKADIMFTDETEARLRTELIPDLMWIPLEEKISPTFAKAAMFNKKDTILQKQFNNWLKNNLILYNNKEK